MTKKKSFLGSVFFAIILLLSICFFVAGCDTSTGGGDSDPTTNPTTETTTPVEEVEEIPTGAVVKNGADYYQDLETALTEASAGDIIILVDNVALTESLVIDKNLTLDLGGYTISGTGVVGLITIADGNYTTLTEDFDDTVDCVEVTIQNGTIQSDTNNLLLIGKYDYVTAVNLNFNCTADVASYDQKCVVAYDYYLYAEGQKTNTKTYVHSTFEYVSGNITTLPMENGKGIYGIGVFSSCTLICGDIEDSDGPNIQSSMSCIALNNLLSNPAYLTIYGGTYTRLTGDGSACSVKEDTIIYLSADCTVKIYGGEFVNTSTNTGVINSNTVTASVISMPYTSAKIQLEIYGGAFENKSGYIFYYETEVAGSKGSDDAENSGDVISICGGTFTEKTPETEGVTSFSQFIDTQYYQADLVPSEEEGCSTYSIGSVENN